MAKCNKFLYYSWLFKICVGAYLLKGSVLVLSMQHTVSALFCGTGVDTVYLIWICDLEC